MEKQKVYNIPNLPLLYDLETKEILKQVNHANKKLAELKGVAQTIPNERILISSLTLQEANKHCYYITYCSTKILKLDEIYFLSEP